MPSEIEFRAAARKVSNWGRWGSEDQLGTLNHITDEKVRESARMVRKGVVFPLGVNFDSNGIWSGNSFRRNPIHLMTMDGGDSPNFLEHMTGWEGGKAVLASRWGERLAKFNDDFIIMPLQAATQWDALSHVYYDDLMYNGVPASAVTSAGATKNSIDQVDVKGIVSRAVILDVARYRGIEHVPERQVIEPEELDEVTRAQGVNVGVGDIVLLRTGWWSQLANLKDGNAWRAGSPGLSWRCAEWLHAKSVAAIAADNIAVEASNYDGSDVVLPLHLLCLRDMGMMFGEIWDLDALAADCAEDGVYECQVVAPPLRITGAVGSPVNPIALK